MTTHDVWELRIELTLEGPIMSADGAPGEAGVDTPMFRLNGRWALPGTLVQGRVREAWTELTDLGAAFPAGAWFGEPGVQPRRALVQMPFALVEEPGGKGGDPAPPHPRIVRIAHDAKLGTAARRYMQVMDAPLLAGETRLFEGIATCAASDEDAKKLAAAIERCLLWTGSAGAMSGVGFGRIAAATVTPARADRFELKDNSDRLALTFRLDRPVCVGRRPPIQELFESDDVIPGGAIKGAVASLGRRLAGLPPGGDAEFPFAPELARHFHAVLVSHAVALVEGRRPTVPPLSLAGCAELGDWLFDASLLDGPVALEITGDGADPIVAAPAFAPDWKDAQRAGANAVCAAARLPRVLQIFHGHDADRRRARDEALFAYEMLESNGIEWEAVVDFTGIEDAATRKTVRGQWLDLVGRGLFGLGKTQARALTLEATRPAAPVDDCQSRIETGPPWVVSLQTPAILCVADDLEDATSLEAAYGRAWEHLSNGTLILKRFFARQMLAGGEYLHRRFGSQAYKPYVLTAPGSVFVFDEGQPRARPGDGAETVDRRTAIDWLRQWLATGVPIPQDIAGQHARDGRPGDDWRSCPYIRQNGYGEIRVNMPLHADLELREPRTLRGGRTVRAMPIKEL